MKNKIVICFVISLMTMMTITSFCFAATPYKSYNYNNWGNAVAAPSGYLPERMITGKQMGVEALSKPQDMFIDDNKDIYIMDTGNNRIVIVDSMFQVKKIISSFSSESNPQETLNEACGLFVDKLGNIYVADKGNGRVLIMDEGGKISRIITKPDSDILQKDFNFQPNKVSVDSSGMIYIQSFGAFQGLLSFSDTGKFYGFFGSNRVEKSVSLIADRLWKKILSRDQREAMVRYVPLEYSSMDITKDDFVYTTTNSAATEQIKKLNPMGVNILIPRSTSPNANRFGDLEADYQKGSLIDTNFIDVKVDDQGFISGLDSEKGRIFQYDQECNLLFVFGGIGDAVGTFKQPSAIEYLDGKFFVLDSEKNNVTVFYPTDFGIKTRQAVKLYNEGKFEETIKPWNEVLQRNSNFELAYVGLGKAYMKMEKYDEAMKCFRLGYDKKGYLDAFKEHRTNLLHNNFTLIAIIIALLFFGPKVYKFTRKVVSEYAG